MNFSPAADRLLIEPFKASIISDFGIIIPDMAQKKQNVGIIAAVGSDCHLHVGDKVMFSENAGTGYQEQGKHYRIVREHDVWFSFQS